MIMKPTRNSVVLATVTIGLVVTVSQALVTPQVRTCSIRRSSSNVVDRRTCSIRRSSSNVVDRRTHILFSSTARSDSASSSNTESSINTPTTKTYLDDGFVFGLEGSGLERPQGKVAQLVVEGDSLETKSWQRVVVWGTLLFHFGVATLSINELLTVVHQGSILPTILESSAVLFAAYVLADFGSGVLHWSVDNYGNGRTPIMGSIIAAFQGHHSAPWTITERGFSNNVYKLCVPFGPIPMAVIAALTGPLVTLFFTAFCTLEVLSQEFHKWSHMTKSQVPKWVNALQDIGLTIGRKPHAQHHLAPYEGNYCIISGICNQGLDRTGFFRRLERFIYEWNGVESNAWKLDADLKAKTLRGDYSL